MRTGLRSGTEERLIDVSIGIFLPLQIAMCMHSGSRALSRIVYMESSSSYRRTTGSFVTLFGCAEPLQLSRPGYDLWFDLICDLLFRLNEFLGVNANWMTTTIGDIRSNRASRDIASFPAPVTIPRGALRVIVPRNPISVSSSLALGGRRSLEVQPLGGRQPGSIILQIATFLPSGSLRV